jgi:DNA-nicking Smr family endonuclease
MKRRPPEPRPVRPRDQRVLTEDERRLWESVAAEAKPLRKRHRPASSPARPCVAVGTPAKPATASQPISPGVKIRRVFSPPPAPLTRRERSQLSRGRKDIEARIDLHGLTQTRAHRALLHFLQDASREGLTFVLVITGKGRASGPDAERGVLRRQVPQWFALPEFRSLVAGFDEAHIGHGGEGALYVRLRRARV